jgi:GNAT superfamily N-acetyltransferase
MSYRIRVATFEDLPVLQALIARSARELSSGDYTSAQVEGALSGAFGVDTQLIRDGTYFVIEDEDAVVACGGWSYRRTLFGSDQRAARDSGELDPAVDAAKIRAFFVDPRHARKGLGTRLLEACEEAAGTRGFTRVELMGTLPGVKLYAARGYVATGRVGYEVAPGVEIEFVPMAKALKSAQSPRG